jgi:hypothetical protein
MKLEKAISVLKFIQKSKELVVIKMEDLKTLSIVVKPNDEFNNIFFGSELQDPPYRRNGFIVFQYTMTKLYDGIVKYEFTLDTLDIIRYNLSLFELLPFKYNDKVFSSFGSKMKSDKQMISFLQKYGYNVVDIEYNSVEDFKYPRIVYSKNQTLVQDVLYLSISRLNFLLSELQSSLRSENETDCLSINSNLDLDFMKEIASEFNIRFQGDCIPKQYEHDLIRYANFILNEQAIPYLIHTPDVVHIDYIRSQFNKFAVPELLPFANIITEISPSYFIVPIFFKSDLNIYTNNFIDQSSQRTKLILPEPDFIVRDDKIIDYLINGMEINLFSLHIPEELMIKLWTSGSLLTLWARAYYRKHKKCSSFLIKQLFNLPYMQSELISYLEQLIQ